MHVDRPMPLVYGVPPRDFYRDFKPTMAFVAELRPGLEGTKIVGKQLLRHRIQPVIICDNMMAHCMERGLVSAVHVFASRLTKKKAVCRTGTLIAVLCAVKRQIPVHLHRGPAGRGPTGRGQGSLLKMAGRRITAPDVKTFAPPTEEVPLIYLGAR